MYTAIPQVCCMILEDKPGMFEIGQACLIIFYLSYFDGHGNVIG
jgi:hypothetical protein